MEYRIGLIHGDGIGPEIVDEAKKVLDAVCEKYGHKFDIPTFCWAEPPSMCTACR